MIYNFRCDQKYRNEILRRLINENRLSQGWGGCEENLDLRRDDFAQACFRHYRSSGMASTRVPTNLLRIRDFKDGDLLITPHIPVYGKLVITVVDGDYPDCYEYVQNDESDQNHRIKAKRFYGLDGNIDIHHLGVSAWFGKLQWLRLPVLPIPQHLDVFDSIIRELEQTPGKEFPTSRLDEYLDRLCAKVLENMKVELRTLSPSVGELSFEEVCKRLVTTAGYTIVRRNWYSDGGDVDLQCTRSRTDVSAFEAGQVNLFVQVKKYTGTTDDLAVRQLLKMMERDQTADGCVMSLGDDFTPEAIKLAESNEILLMNGETICTLLLRLMVSE
jgi:hypothetical protein